jgi:hypothetical protein
MCTKLLRESRHTGWLLRRLPEPEDELRPGTAMVSSSPDAEGEVAPIAGQCKHTKEREKGNDEGREGEQAKTNTDWRGVVE